MTAKEYLFTIRALDVQIKQKCTELDELHGIATSIGSFDYSKDRVQTSPSGEAPYVKTAERIVELGDEVDSLTARYRDMTAWMDGICGDVLTDEEYAVLFFRYYHNWRWTDVMRVMEREDRMIYRLCNRALDKLQDIVLPLDVSV